MSSNPESSRKRNTRPSSAGDSISLPPKKKKAPARRKASLSQVAAEKTLEEREGSISESTPDALSAAVVSSTKIIEALKAQLQATEEKASRAAKENADLLQMVKEGAQCPVCFEVKAVRFVFGCGHHLCPSCVCGLLENERRSRECAGTCPLCKTAITKLSPAHYILEKIVNTAVGESLCRNQDWSQRFVECAKKMLEQGRDKGCILLLRTAADRGNSHATTDAQIMLGSFYVNCLCGYNRNLNRARKWFERAASRNDSRAQYMLGALYYYSNQFDRAFEYFSLSAAQGNSLGLFALGECYYRGKGTDRNCTNAFNYFSRSSEIRAKKRLGDCYYHGHGTEQDFSKSFAAYCLAESEYGPSHYGLGMLYFKGRLLCKERMYSLAVFHFQKTLEKMDHADREPLIEHDIVHPRLMAAYMLGICYLRGLGVEQNTSRSRKYFRISANGGLSKGMFELAKSYMEEKKYDAAVAHLKSAAEKNHTEAMNCLGYCYSRALGVPQSLKVAAQWYKKSAEMKSATAMFNLALCYAQGKGVKMNFETARHYFEGAAGMEHKAAQSALDAWARLEEQCF